MVCVLLKKVFISYPNICLFLFFIYLFFIFLIFFPQCCSFCDEIVFKKGLENDAEFEIPVIFGNINNNINNSYSFY